MLRIKVFFVYKLSYFLWTKHLFPFNARTGGFQHCGDVLWRESQDNSSVRVLPRVCALPQSLQSTFKLHFPHTHTPPALIQDLLLVISYSRNAGTCDHSI